MSGGEHTCVVDLGRVRLAVSADHSGLVDYLAEFYRLLPTRSGPAADWTIRAELGEPTPDMARTRFGVGYRVDPSARRLLIRACSAEDVAITTRKVAREPHLDYCDARGSVLLHAAALTYGNWLIVLAGDGGAGKTTLALSGMLDAGCGYISNDHLILYHDTRGLIATSLPTLIPVKVGTYLDIAGRLPEPLPHQLDLDRFQAMPAARRYAEDTAVFYTYRGLGQDNPVHLDLADRRVLVVLAGYAHSGEPPRPPEREPDPEPALYAQVRADWVFDPAQNTRMLPTPQRDRAAYAHDASHRVRELIAHAPVLRWRHHGHITPLLTWLDTHLGGHR